MIYLDNAATTFPKPEIVYKTMDEFLRNSCVNAGRGSYNLAKNATELIDETRRLIADLAHIKNIDGVVFTPSATIAINQVLNGLEWKDIKNVFVTPFEHNAIMRTLHYMKKKYNFEIVVLPFDNITLELNVQKAKILFAEKKPEVVLMSHISNVTGYILPVDKIIELSNGVNAITIVDCAQSFGVVDIDLSLLKVDFIIFAGHKSLYGPLGIAGYINNGLIKLNNHIVGGTGSDSTNLEMPDDGYKQYEAGSYNVYAISGLNASIKWINEIGMQEIFNHKKELTNKLVKGLKEIEDIELYIPKDSKNHIGVVSFNLPDYSAGDMASILNNEFDIAVRSGHHCAPLLGKFLGGYAENGTVRVSMSYFSTNEEIEEVIKAINELID